jgi:tetratricopeptide (TPR) repeat protein
MTRKEFNTNANDNARVNIIGQMNAEKVDFGDCYHGQQQISVVLDAISPKRDAKRWIDRTQPQKDLLQRVETKTSTVIEIVAQGGFGKSLLAAWLYENEIVRKQYEKPLWVNFRKVPTFEQFARWVLQEIGFLIQVPQVTNDELIVELTNRLINLPVLLVMDQIETLQDASDRESFVKFLQKWQQEGRKSLVLVTTRSSLIGDEDNCLKLAGFLDCEGANFLKRQGIQAGDEHLFSELVRITEGHPLLLNLAASWLRQEAGGVINTEGLGFFNHLFRQYKGNSEAKVEEIFALLFAELPERLRSLLLGVVVYRDEFGLVMAQSMLKDVMIDDLRLLTEQGFLLEDKEQWTLHPLMRSLIKQKLQSSDRYLESHRNAISYFTKKVNFSPNSFEDCYEALEIVHHCCELRDYALAHTTMIQYFHFLVRRCFFDDLIRVYERITESWKLENSDNIDEQRILGWAWIHLGHLYFEKGYYLPAIDANNKALTLFEGVGAYDGQTASLTNLGNCYSFLREYPTTIVMYVKSLSICNDIGDPRGMGSNYCNLGNVYLELENTPLAIENFNLAIDILLGDSNRDFKFNCLMGLGKAYWFLGEKEIQSATKFFRKAHELSCELNDPQCMASSSFVLGLSLAKFESQRSKGYNYLLEAKRIYEELKLDSKVEECDSAIYSFNGIIPIEL